MRSSSATQLALDYEAPAALRAGVTSIGPAAGAPPTVPKYDPVSAATSQIAGRMNAASVSDREREELLRERASLLNKKFAGQITRKESHRLEYVRWSLDRIEDAKHGYALEALDEAVTRYESILDELKKLGLQLEAQLPRKKR
jgi:hypothetical protein